MEPNSSGLSYSTFLGGTGDGHIANSVAIDSAAEAFVTGATNSADFPLTSGAFQATLKGSYNAFVTELNASGSAPIFSTYLGGCGSNQQGRGIALDAAGSSYAGGYTNASDFPVTAHATQATSGGCYDAFVSKLNQTGSALLFRLILVAAPLTLL